MGGKRYIVVACVGVLTVHALQSFPQLSTTTVAGCWAGASAGGCPNYPTWACNPQYQLTLAAPETVTIELTQHEVSAREGSRARMWERMR